MVRLNTGGPGRPRTRALLGLAATLGAVAFLGVQAGNVGASYLPPKCPTVTYHSVPTLDAQRVCMNLGVATHATTPGTYLFMTPGFDGEGIYSDTGVLVWWRTHDPKRLDGDVSVVNLWGKPYLAVWSGRQDYVKSSDDFHVNNGQILLYNEQYQRVGSITPGGRFAGAHADMHEFRVTPQGDALLGIYEVVRRRVRGQEQSVAGYVVQKVSLARNSKGFIHTRRLLFQWRSLRHIPLSDSYLNHAGVNAPWDYFHGNAIAQDTDGNLIVSARNTWAIYKISIKTGRIMWQVGGKGDSQLKHPWCYQHDVTPLGNNQYSVFDDGGIGPGCGVNESQHAARGLIFQVDPTKHPATVRLLAAYTHRPGILSTYLGSAQRLDNGHMLVGYGNFPEITEYSGVGHVLMDLSMSNYSFRGVRFAWDGRPTTRPDVAARLTNGQTKVWASWNGSTEVTAWRVLGGSSTTGPLNAIGQPTRKGGFETRIVIPHPEPVVAVQALNAQGRVLATSKTITTNP